MKNQTRIALLSALLSCLWLTPYARAQNLVSDRLLNQSTSAMATRRPQEPWVKNVREARVSKSVLNKRTFWFNVAPGKRIRAYRRGFRSADRSGASISGRLRSLGPQNGELGNFVLSVTNSGGIAGTFQTSKGQSYSLVGSGDSIVVKQIDESQLPPCGNAPVSGASDPYAVHSASSDQDGYDSDSSAPPVAALSASSTVRSLVVYPPSVRTSLGSGAAVDALISNMISYANTSYQNSAVSMTVEKAFSAEVSQELPSGLGDPFGSALVSLTGTSDGLWDEVHALRATYAADLVTILINNNQYCGVAWLNDDSYTSAAEFAPYGFSVVNTGCISSFAHELGHNMGLNHNIEDSGGAQGKFIYSYGWRWQGNNSVWYRDIMSYQSSNDEIRVPYFSNPNITYAGVATGDAAANNALSLETLRDEIADYVGGAPAATPTNTPTPPPGSTSTPTPPPGGTPGATATPTPSSGAVSPPSGGNGGTPVATPTPDGSSIWGIRKFAVNCAKKTAKISVKSADGIPAPGETVWLLIGSRGIAGTTNVNGVATIKNAKIATAKTLKPLYAGVSWGYKASCKKTSKAKRR